MTSYCTCETCQEIHKAPKNVKDAPVKGRALDKSQNAVKPAQKAVRIDIRVDISIRDRRY